MAEISLGAMERPAIVSTTEKAARLFFVDNIRTTLAIFVVLHHIALVFGASLEGFYYVEPPFAEPLAFKILLLFALMNQAWFMGAFFLFAGYFTPNSFNRKGAGHFLQDRLLRLGLPILFFYFLLNPIASIGYWLMPATLTGITEPLTWHNFWQAYPDLIGLGPLWFVAMLLLFSFGYAIWQWLTDNPGEGSMYQASFPGYASIGIFIVALALVSYLFRMEIPIGETVAQFPSLAYLPQYLSFFVIGVIASRRDWLQTVPDSIGRVGFAGAAVATAILFPLAFSGQLFSLELTNALDNAMGSGHWQSAIYAFWDAIFAVGMVLALVTFFRRFRNEQGLFGHFLAKHSYAVYITHLPLVVFLTYGMRDMELAALPKFGLAAFVILPVCYIVAYFVHEIPGASRIL